MVEENELKILVFLGEVSYIDGLGVGGMVPGFTKSDRPGTAAQATEPDRACHRPARFLH